MFLSMDEEKSFADQTKNGFVYQVGEFSVKVQFLESGPTLEERLEEYRQLLEAVSKPL